jgi:hypothetical protein
MFTCHSNSMYDAPSTSWDMAIVSKTGPMIAEGPAIAQGSKAKPTSRARVAQSKQSEGQSDKWGGQQLAFSKTHQGDTTLSSFISDSQLGGFLHAPPCGMAPSRPGFSARDYLGKTLETT